ncbi:FAD-dependent oxidoreductase [Acerihabitans sp. TG2]|uniref:NAD(P)/FAD-dependent oxidoreductase n=1 Tax=Acerihabitans sp. TG2 TaxID=3096008 RepID=UPI002B239E36|nr:FAD-dependent oxidoreductase [Acerihabitans sp. TG2]MEA9392553.1 FAD-dependent oxidoreductase [Acerihabitans sp. TG2]
MTTKVAIIGSGISGLSCAWLLAQRQPDCDITVFESAATLGGHTATQDVISEGKTYAIDTGFIVYNSRTYPQFIALLNELGIEGQPTEMSFSVRNPLTGLEYNGHSLNSLFAQRSNLFKPSFWRFILDILRFNKLCKARLLNAHHSEETLGDLLDQNGFTPFFALHYVLPMGAAIWSSTLGEMANFPLAMFLRFFDNHGLLDVTNRPQWMVVPGGSREYIRRMQLMLPERVTLLTNTPVTHVTRFAQGVTLYSNHGEHGFDQVIFACHADQALAILGDHATADEHRILGALPYQANEVILHTDTRLLPRAKCAWASWNYQLPPSHDAATHAAMPDSLPAHSRRASVTYNMNILQGLHAPQTFCVSLNPLTSIDESKTLWRTTYMHPVLNLASHQAQQQRHRINGHHRSWFCGAYWYNGFHEDGVNSARDVVELIALQRTRSPQRRENPDRQSVQEAS